MEDKKKFSRRDFLRLGGMGASAALLASCAPKAEEDAPAGEEVPSGGRTRSSRSCHP